MILLVLCFGFFMILLDTTIVNIAIPSIIDGLFIEHADVLRGPEAARLDRLQAPASHDNSIRGNPVTWTS